MHLPANLERRQQKSAQEHIDAITEEWRETQEATVIGIVKTGKRLVEAKDDLPFGVWERVVAYELPFSEDVAHQLMTIAKHPVLADPGYARDLPASYDTLYVMARVDKKLGKGELVSLIEDHTLNSKTRKKDVTALWKPPSGEPRDSKPPPSIKTRKAYIKFLKSCSEQERWDELKAFRTAIGGGDLGLKIEVVEPLTIEAKVDDEGA
jgi:hypothetical protein